MHVSAQVAHWVQDALDQHRRPGEEFWYDATMAPGGGPNNAPFLACVLTAPAAVLGSTYNVVSTFPDYTRLNADDMNDWVLSALTELRNAQSTGLADAGSAIKRLDGPGSLYVPGGPA